MWIRVEMVLFRPGTDFMDTVEYVLKAWSETHAFQRGARLQIWECAPYLSGIWWLHLSCSGYRGVNSDIDIKSWLLAQWVLTSAYASGHRLQIWNVDSYDSTAALFESVALSRAQTIEESIGLHKPALVKPEGAVEQLYTGLSMDEIVAASKRMADAGLTIKEAAQAMQQLGTAAAQVPDDMRKTPGRVQALLWHVMACIWPTAGYVQWVRDEHPRWKRR